MEINDVDVKAEVIEVFTKYEQALISGEQSVLRELFWDSSYTLRYGIVDQQFGIDEISQWRQKQRPLPANRTLSDTQVTTFGDDTAVVNTCFTYPGSKLLGRQSQTWIRFENGWRIVSAHVSQIPVNSDPVQ